MSLYNYLNRISGTSDAFGQLKTSIAKAFHSKSFKLFWRNWNPLFGYMLSKYINRPLSKMTNGKISSLLTFLFSGLILHDLWIMPIFYILFKKVPFFPVTLIFLCFWIGMVFENLFKLRIYSGNDKLNVFINIAYILAGSIAGGIISALI